MSGNNAMIDNPFQVKQGDKWRDKSKRAKNAVFVIDEIIVDKGKHKASGVRSGSGRKSKVLLTDFGRFEKMPV